MKSNRQRRSEIKLGREKKRLKQEQAAARGAARQRANLGVRDVPVGHAGMGPNGEFPDHAPDGCYVDRPFRCKDCGKDEVWTATQQKWWYEVARGNPYVRRVRCTPCGRAFKQERIKSREQTSRKRASRAS